eukprot:10982229-Ditylum_brightwellii.AAC.1
MIITAGGRCVWKVDVGHSSLPFWEYITNQEAKAVHKQNPFLPVAMARTKRKGAELIQEKAEAREKVGRRRLS